LPATLLFYESPYRLLDTLVALHHHMGNRKVTVARELTKKLESYIRGSIEDVMGWARENKVKGEFSIVVEGSDVIEEKNALGCSDMTNVQKVDDYIENDTLSSKDAIKRVALESHLPKRTV